MASKLSLYNGALRECKEAELTALTDNVQGRHLLDSIYDAQLKYCLEQGAWNFAIRAIEANSDTNVEPTFGFSFAFEKPTDIVRILEVASDAEFNSPLINYVEEGDYWYADADPIYVRYTSDDIEYGLDLAKWPETFTFYVETRLALLIVKRLTGSMEQYRELKNDAQQRLTDARSKDALRESSKRFPQGRLVSARLRGSTPDQRRAPSA